MPLNYLDLQPQIKSYAGRIQALQQDVAARLPLAMDLLNTMAVQTAPWLAEFSEKVRSQPAGDRCALPSGETVNAVIDPAARQDQVTLLASDGSQIIPNTHDALSMALVNTSRIIYNIGSKQPPQVLVQSRLLENDDSASGGRLPGEDLIALQRDLSEMEILADWQPEGACCTIALADGPLELFHEPRQSPDFQEYFQKYLSALGTIHQKGFLLGGYTDKPRANLVVRMLEWASPDPAASPLQGVSDALLFGLILAPGQRSVVFRLQSTSSHFYRDELALHFFYLNSGRSAKPWVARVEIPEWVARNPSSLAQLHAVLLDQCRLMGSQPYPYLLHRAHEAAVVHFDEKEQLEAMLAQALQSQGAGIGSKSYKLSAKQLQSRTRMVI